MEYTCVLLKYFSIPDKSIECVAISNLINPLEEPTKDNGYLHINPK